MIIVQQHIIKEKNQMYKQGIINYAEEELKKRNFITKVNIHKGALGQVIEIEVNFKDNNLKGYFTGSKMLIRTKNNFTTTITQGIPTTIRSLYTKTKEKLL